MKTLKLTAAQYLKAIKLGYYEPVKCISVFKKIVTHYKLCGRTEKILIEISNKSPNGGPPPPIFNNKKQTS